MGYKIVAVNPLIKPFPLVSLGIANMVSFDDAKNRIFEKYRKMSKMKIDADDARVDVEGGWKLNVDGRAEIFGDYEKAAEKELGVFKEGRWLKIEPALKLHLKRQERRLTHFKSACRFSGCDNPRPLGTLYYGASRMGGHAVHRHNAPLFCGVHAHLRRAISAEAKNELIANSSKRLAVS